MSKNINAFFQNVQSHLIENAKHTTQIKLFPAAVFRTVAIGKRLHEKELPQDRNHPDQEPSFFSAAMSGPGFKTLAPRERAA